MLRLDSKAPEQAMADAPAGTPKGDYTGVDMGEGGQYPLIRLQKHEAGRGPPGLRPLLWYTAGVLESWVLF
jgi:hypothetical protein